MLRALVVLAVLAYVILDTVGCSPAQAAPTQREAVEVAAGTPALSNVLGIPSSFKIPCKTTPQKIQAAAGMLSYRCVNESSRPVFVGSANDGGPVRNGGIDYCTDDTLCFDGAAWGGDVQYEYCALIDAGSGVDAGTVTISCRSGR